MNDNFCVLPFFGAEYKESGFDSPCCLMTPSNRSIEQIRKDFNDNQRPVECNKCWINEDSGRESDRQIKNRAYDFYADRDLRYVKEDCSKGLYSQQIIKLYTSTLCNSTCATCSSYHSTAWAALEGKSIELKKISTRTLDHINFAHVKMLSFVGGEPLYEKLNFDILDQLVDANNTNCYISMVTNGSTKITPSQCDTLSKFKNLNFCLSIDGVGPVFEYLRYPLEWDMLLNNIQLYKSMGIQLSVSYTISNLNVLYHNETVKWFKDNNLQFNHNIVYTPAHFHPNVLPNKLKQDLTLSKFFTHLVDPPLLDQFVAEVQRQDQIKGISINDYLPKLSTLFCF
jgi:sulfatase maturation enzyme AslB (radical SAM superfamily)